jgi:DNA-binding winged helix-turn-helix (wHTH) protein/Tol biopolymer transport system component
MSSLPQARGLPKFRFDAYEVDPRAGELRKHGYRVPLEDRPFRALQILLEHAPEVVTREELQKRLWSADVFVDFDHGLNKAIGKVRRALNDSADNPRFVETVGRRGYRFIAPLTSTDGQDAPAQLAPTAIEGREKGTQEEGQKKELQRNGGQKSDGQENEAQKNKGRETHVRNGRVLALVGVGLVAVLLAAFLFRPEMPKPQVVRVVQLTKSGEAWPLEPMATDGPRLYYQALANNLSPSAAAPNWRLKQVLLNGNEDTVIPGTSDRVHSFRIRGLSSDDTEFLALSRTADGWMPVTLPVVGGSPRRLGSLIADDLAWSHDGSVLAYSRGKQLFLSNPDGTGARFLASVPGDIAYLSWSPDDRRLGFTVLTEQDALWEVGADGRDLHERRFNLPGKAMECCGEWTPDGKYYVFRSRREGASNLWAVEEKSEWWRRSNRDPVQLTFGPMNYYQPLPSRNGKTIFAIGTLPSGELVRYDAKQKDFVPFLGGLSADHLEFSRDGQWIAYVTLPERTLWRARSDGSESFQLTFPPMQVDSRPHWSADGKRITFGAKLPGELMRLYTISPETGVADLLPGAPYSQATPDWMPGGNSLVYGCMPGVDHPSVIALYRIDLQTRHSEKIPGTEGLYDPLWSPDGHHLAAVDAVSQGLFLVDVNTGKRSQLSQSAAVFPIWSADSQYLYFAARDHEIIRVRVPDGHEEKVFDLSFRAASGSFGLTPDGAPIVLREHGHYDVYALSLATP